MPSETAVWPPQDTEALKLHPSLALALLRAGEMAPTRLCGQRQFRALLQQGNGLFWQPGALLYWRGRGTAVWYVLSGKESGR